ncbi:peptidoglycan-binding protein [Vibrio crassostreae]|uniref:peptidoglycan-binding protein n=1 Tax=Vibrio crassostreae TaxID=246167 RepID=UPI001B30D1E4|nr:peptidoglycan-binding protein [Vibrio crassostreae]
MSNKNPKGFSGLSQLHSKSEDKADSVESDFQSDPSTDTITTPLSKTQSGSQRDNTVDVGSESEVTDGTLQDEQQEGNKSGISWGYIFGFLLIVGIFMAISQGNDSPSSVPKAATGSSLANPTAKTPTASQLGSSSVVGKTNKPRNETPKLQYNKPPVGSNNILSVSQIRWCTREIMRIDAMRNIFDTNGGIDEFNRIVNDYNSRCSHYRYRQRDLSKAEREVETHKSTITTEAIREAKLIDQRFKKTSNVSTKSASNKPNAQLTREVQQLLTVLGYKPGPIDGDYGPGTASAIKVFQRDSGLAQTGRVDRELLSSLRSKERSKSSLNVGVKTNNHQSNDNGIPANAKIDYTGRKWVCNSGYRQDGNRCLKITVPVNAKIDYTGRKWVCNSGYRQDGNRCLKITVPANAQIDYTGRKWVCNSGYRQEGDQCIDY